MNCRFHFVVNPLAGRGKSLRRWEEVSTQLHKYGEALEGTWSITSSMTYDDYPFHQLHKDTILVCVGGDGSLHIVGKIALNHKLALGIVPAGTGNDFATTLGLTNPTSNIVHTLIHEEPSYIDVLQVDDDIALNVAGFGLDAAVVHFIEKNTWLKKLGALGYGIAVPSALISYQPYDAEVTVDGVTTMYQDVSLCALANGGAFGGGMKVAPTASLFDGKVDVCVVAGLRKLELLRIFPTIYRGQHVHEPSVHLIQGKHVQIEFKSQLPLAEYDGEPKKTASAIQVSVLHQQLRVVRPKQTEP